ncbi:TraB/GumN family protein [Paenibacillus sp. TRM 82003]|nr:TraB/GumN family protein [Paenibacillus sp. TRM 82003]
MKNWGMKLSGFVVSATMVVTGASAALAAEQVEEVQVNGEAMPFGAQVPVVENGKTFVPLETALKTLKLTEMSAETRTIGGAAYVPLRQVGEAAGYEVRWDEATRTVLLISKEEAVRGFLWEVQHDGDSVHLIGSMHFADESFYPLPAAYEAAFDDAEYLGLEVDVSKAATPGVQQLIMELGTYHDGTTLADHVSAELYAQIGGILKQNGLEANALDTFKPWVVETMIATLKSAQAGYEGGIGIDMYFAQKANERQLPIIELETYESQLMMFNSFSKELQATNLQAVVDNFDAIDESVDQMADIWKSGDDEGLLGLTEEMAKSPEYRKAMLTDRNAAMVEKIVSYLENPEEADYLIAIGAAHFPGDDGIVKLLEERGYVVTRK